MLEKLLFGEMAEPTTPSKLVDLCRVCGEAFNNPKNKHNLFIKGKKQDYTVVLEDVTGASVQADDDLKAVCGTCRSKLIKYRRCLGEVTKLAEEIKHLASVNPTARVKRCAKSTPEPVSHSHERRKVFLEDVSSPAKARRNLFQDVPTSTHAKVC